MAPMGQATVQSPQPKQASEIFIEFNSLSSVMALAGQSSTFRSS
jgi:hypothetical protein